MRSSVGVALWVLVLATLAMQRRASTTDVLRATLALSGGASTVYLSQVRRTLDELADAGLVESASARHGRRESIAWTITNTGRERARELAALCSSVASACTNRKAGP